MFVEDTEKSKTLPVLKEFMVTLGSLSSVSSSICDFKKSLLIVLVIPLISKTFEYWFNFLTLFYTES